jgi:methyl-accepting chemotaxis protein
MLALIILGMGISTTVSYYKSKGALEESITGQINQQADSTLKVMASWLRDRRLDVSSWSQQSVFGIALEDSFLGKAARKSANLQLDKFKKDYKHYENLFIANTTGDIVASS